MNPGSQEPFQLIREDEIFQTGGFFLAFVRQIKRSNANGDESLICRS